jgi:hypothetical protein
MASVANSAAAAEDDAFVFNEDPDRTLQPIGAGKEELRFDEDDAGDDEAADEDPVYLTNPASKNGANRVFDMERGIYVPKEQLSTKHPTAARLSRLSRRSGTVLSEKYGRSGTLPGEEVFDAMLGPLLEPGSWAPAHYVPRLFPARYIGQTVELGISTGIKPFPVALNTYKFPVGLVVAVFHMDKSARPSLIPFLGSPITAGPPILYYVMQKMMPLGRTSGEYGSAGYYAAPASVCVILKLAILRVITTGVAVVKVVTDEGVTFTVDLAEAMKSKNRRWRLAWALFQKQYPQFMMSDMTLRTVSKPTPGNELSKAAAETPEELVNMPPVSVLQ